MIVRHFDLKSPKTQPPQDEGWEQIWSGYYMMTKCLSQQSRAEWAERDRATRAEGMMTETEFQRDCFLSVLADIKRKHVNMFELGAGWARMCLLLAGVVDYKIIPCVPVSYRCLAVEGEPTHYQWAQEHFKTQNIDCCTVVHGAVADKNGTCRFAVDASPDSCYGQAVHGLMRSRKIPGIRSLYSLITKKTIKIPMFTVDKLIQTYEFDHVDIIQMDVQGAEYKVMLGAAEAIRNDVVDYLLISVHQRELNGALRQLLSPKFDLVVDIYRNSIGTVDGFSQIRVNDGIQLYKRKNI